MKVKDLKAMLANVPDDVDVVVPSFDHSYISAYAYETTALINKRKKYTEDFGEDVTPEKEWGERVPVILISAN